MHAHNDALLTIPSDFGPPPTVESIHRSAARAREDPHTPVVGYPAVLYAHDIDRLEVNWAVGLSNAEEWSVVRPVVALERRYTVSVGELPVDLRVKVGECDTKIGVELSDTRLVRSGTRLRRVVDKVVGEQFFEHVEISLSLNFFGVASDDGFGGI